MRAATTGERISDKLRSLYESFAQQPLGRMADLSGLTNLGGMASSFTTPDSGWRMGEMPIKPPSAGIMSKITPNASGESAASMEAINRMRSMRNKGQQYVVRRGGTERHLIGPEAVDYNPRPGEEYGILENGIFRLLQRGTRGGI